MNTPISFELAKLLKEEGFDIQTLHFYTKPNSKMFGIDEHGRYYPIKNTAKSLWITGNAVALNYENVYLAPTIAEVVMWLYEKHGIWISVLQLLQNGTEVLWYASCYEEGVGEDIEEYYDSPTKAYEAAIKYLLQSIQLYGKTT